MNTGVSTSAEGAVNELTEYTRKIQKKLSELEEREYLWPFSNPPYIINEENVPIAQFTGEQANKTIYREYLYQYRDLQSGAFGGGGMESRGNGRDRG